MSRRRPLLGARGAAALERLVLIAGAALGAACSGCFLPLGEPVCEIARGKVVAEDDRRRVPCSVEVLLQRPPLDPIPLGKREIRTDEAFSYRTFAPTGTVHVAVACDEYVAYTSEPFVRDQRAMCPPVIDVGTVRMKRREMRSP